MTTIDETIQAAAEKFGITVETIRSHRRCGAISLAREWVVAKHPEATCTELMRALGLRSHQSILYIRRKLSQFT